MAHQRHPRFLRAFYYTYPSYPVVTYTGNWYSMTFVSEKRPDCYFTLEENAVNEEAALVEGAARIRQAARQVSTVDLLGGLNLKSVQKIDSPPTALQNQIATNCQELISNYQFIQYSPIWFTRRYYLFPYRYFWWGNWHGGSGWGGHGGTGTGTGTGMGTGT